MSDALNVVLRDLAQTAHHIIHVLNRKIVLRLAQSRQKCFQLPLDLSDTFLVVRVGLIVAFLGVISRLSDHFNYLFAVFINLLIASFVVIKLILCSFDREEGAHLLLGLLDSLGEGHSVLQVVLEVMRPVLLSDRALRT